MKIQDITTALFNDARPGCNLLTKSFFIAFLMMFSLGIHAQNRSTISEMDDNSDGIIMNPQLKAITTAEGESGYIFFRQDLKLDAEDLFTTHKAAFNLGNDDQMVLKAEETDDLGMVHRTYQHYHKGVRVMGSSYITHAEGSKLSKGNGRLLTGINMNATPSISESAALQIALTKIGGTKYYWEDEATEALKQEMDNDPNASWYPEGELIFVSPGNIAEKARYRLAYHFTVNVLQPDGSWDIYIDANNGEVIMKLSNDIMTSYDGSAATKYSGIRPIKTSQTGILSLVGLGDYILHDQTRGNGIRTYDANLGTDMAASVDFEDDNNFWNNVNAQKDEIATDAHWGIAMSYDYYKNAHGWSSIDGNNKLLRNYVHWKSATWVNAFYSSGRGDIFAYGDGDPAENYLPLTTLDIVGHEYTHGVVNYAVANGAGMPYMNESGAINESYADIFGTCIEFYAKPSESNWLIAEECATGNPSFMRSIPDPKAAGQPTTYLQDTTFDAGSAARNYNAKIRLGWLDWQAYMAATGDPWDSVPDRGGVHQNNTVGSHWFYLLSVGGSGTNDKGNKYTVEGIGRLKAEKIAYRALQYHLISAATFPDMRSATVEAAKELYAGAKAVDPCSNEVMQTINAWYAVGVGDPLLMFKDAKTENSACDEPTGKAEVSVKGVKGTPEYLWSTGDTTRSIDSLYAGEYTVTVTDTSTGCSIDTTLEVEEDVNFWMSGYGISPTECGKEDGYVKVLLVGVNGTPIIQWSTGDTTEKVENLGEGEYCVTVIDTHTTCVKDTCFELEEWGPEVHIAGGGNRTYCKGDPQPPVTLTASASPCPGCTYKWSTGATGTSITVSSSGSYSVTASTNDTCTGTASTTVQFYERDCDDPDGPEWEIPRIRSSDPNDITGPSGYGPERFINNVDEMPFRIRYENDPVFATAPALKVVVTMPFHSNAQMFSFKLGDFGFGDFVFTVPENSTFYTNRLDVSDSLGVLVDVTAGVNVAEQQAFWIFNSIDPTTGLEPADATLGYLPVNDSITRRGEGFVNFTMNPKPTTVTGDTIAEQATIVFDINEDIPTNTWVNTIDAVAPSSSVDTLRQHSDSTTIRIRITGTDDVGGSGVGSYALYYSEENSSFQLYGEFPADTGIYFTGKAETDYEFFSIATDNVGNTEPMKQMGEASTTLHETPLSIWNFDGQLTYQNTASTPLEGVVSEITDTAGTVYSATSNTLGQFSHPELIQGDYLMGFNNPYPWKGGNAVDALLILRHFAELTNLGIVEQGAADVNGSGAVNSTDAQQVATRFVNLIDTFAAGDWYYNSPNPLTLVSDCTLYIRALCFGDVNGSYTPGTKMEQATVSLNRNGSMLVDENEVIELPLIVDNSLALGSISLALNYPANKMEIQSIAMPKANKSDLFWNIQHGQLRFAWYDPNGIEISEGETLLILRVKLDKDVNPDDLYFSLGEESQVSDRNAIVHNNAGISIPKLEFAGESGYSLIGNYPNPFRDQTEISFSIPEQSKVKLVLLNELGEQVDIISDKRYGAGTHSVRYKAKNLASGVYFCRMEAQSGDREIIMSKRMVLVR